jgi:hypothetical protein
MGSPAHAAGRMPRRALIALLLVAIAGPLGAGSQASPTGAAGAPAAAPPRLVARALPRSTAPVSPATPRTGCITGQTNDLDGEAGIEDAFRVQSPCLPGQPGTEGDLTGFAFVLSGCADGGIGEIDLCFGTAELEDEFYLFVWRSVGGLPNDACGLAAYGTLQHVQDEFPLFAIYDICAAHVPIAEGERIFIGVIYRYVSELFGADWFLARNVADGYADHGYVNLSGKPGVWVDMAGLNQGLGNRWGVFMTNVSECGGLAVEESSWGAVKALLR